MKNRIWHTNKTDFQRDKARQNHVLSTKQLFYTALPFVAVAEQY